MPSRIRRITRRQGGGSAGVYKNTSRKPTTQTTKLADESGLAYGGALWSSKMLFNKDEP